jgi:hypothetical protein
MKVCFQMVQCILFFYQNISVKDQEDDTNVGNGHKGWQISQTVIGGAVLIIW